MVEQERKFSGWERSALSSQSNVVRAQEDKLNPLTGRLEKTEYLLISVSQLFCEQFCMNFKVDFSQTEVITQALLESF